MVRNRALLLGLFILITILGSSHVWACSGFVDDSSDSMFAGAIYPYERVNEKHPIPDELPDGIQEDIVTTASCYKIRVWRDVDGQIDKPIVIYAHGNGMNLATVHKAGFFKKLKDLGAHFVSFDYPKYGQSEGAVHERAYVESGRAVVDHIKSMYPSHKIILWGRSLGSAVATQVAQYYDESEIQALLLTSAWSASWKLISKKFSCWKSWCQSLAEENEYLNEETAPHITIPTIQFHGTKDTLVPYDLGVQLGEKFHPETHMFVPIEGAEHNDIFQFQEMWKLVEQTVQTVQTL